MAEPDLQARRLRFELRELALVALGAVPGALLRWQSGGQLGPHLGGSAGANLLMNLIGSFLLGFLAGPIPRRTIRENQRHVDIGIVIIRPTAVRTRQKTGHY